MSIDGLELLVYDVDQNYWNQITKNNKWCLKFDITGDPEVAAELVFNKAYSLVLFNINMFEQSYEVGYKKIRKHYDGPIVIIADSVDDKLRLELLELGVFDVVESNITSYELQLRAIRIYEVEIKSYIYKVADYTVDAIQQRVYYNGQRLKLARIPYNLLVYLLDHPNRDIGRDELLEKVWNYQVNDGDRIVDRNINTLRRVTKDKRIKSVYGRGYKIDIPDVETSL